MTIEKPHSASRLLVKRLCDDAVLPERKSKLAAGYDLSSVEETIVKSGGKAIVKTGLQIACPEGTYGRIAPRSGLAAKNFIDVGAGVIDADYRGEVGVILFNFGSEDFEVKKGSRIAQLVLEKICLAEVEEVKVLVETERGASGFGSTGVIQTDNDDTKKITNEEGQQEQAAAENADSPSAKRSRTAPRSEQDSTTSDSKLQTKITEEMDIDTLATAKDETVVDDGTVATQ